MLFVTLELVTVPHQFSLVFRDAPERLLLSDACMADGWQPRDPPEPQHSGRVGITCLIWIHASYKVSR